jgi:cell division protease FtsH
VIKEDLLKGEKKLQVVANKLKKDFIGLDSQIDQIIESIRIWYIMPDLLTRPPIINLWGMTGTGKTDLVRKLTNYLGFSDRMVEIQMDAGVEGKWDTLKTVSDAIMLSDIEESQPGILLFDEFQRFNSRGAMGERIERDKYNDIWMLMSDGILNSSVRGTKGDILEEIFYEEYHIREGDKPQKTVKDKDEVDSEESTPDDEESKPYGDRNVNFYRARMLKKKLKLDEPLSNILQWNNRHALSVMKERVNNNDLYTGYDYSKVLIFICGNLDNVYDMSRDVAQADISADILHKYSLNINLVDIKRELGNLFFPEQVARLGNNHVIYHCLNTNSYRSIIRKTLDEFIFNLKETHGVDLQIDDTVTSILYDNFVYPTQGVRPVFSGINMFLSEVVPRYMFQLFNDNIELKRIAIHLDDDNQFWCKLGNGELFSFTYDFAMQHIKESICDDTRTLYAVHESAHALVYMELFGYAPKSLNTEITSFSGAFVLPNKVVNTKDTLLNKIMVLYAGTVAESIIFRDDNRSAGCESDIKQATRCASNIVRKYGMGESSSGKIGKLLDHEHQYTINNTDDSDKEINHILSVCKETVHAYLTSNIDLLTRLVDEILVRKTMNCKELCEFHKEQFPSLKYIDPLDLDTTDEIIHNYAEVYANFK